MENAGVHSKSLGQLSFAQKVLVLSTFVGFPGSLISLYFVWSGNYSSKLQWTISLIVLCIWLGGSIALRSRVVFSIRTLSNLLSALREGDYSVRARIAKRDDVLGDVMYEINSLSQLLRTQRFGAIEATTLLRKVMAEIDSAVFAFDSWDRLQLVNKAGERLLGTPAERLLGSSAEELHLEDCLQGENNRTFQKEFRGKSGRWGMRRSSFREGGKPHQLL
ncbi:PAS domain S-box protein, partial [bacterium]|nr:PAS domain S-box protein [candidate division CSSED10-310 bacterium]